MENLTSQYLEAMIRLIQKRWPRGASLVKEIFNIGEHEIFFEMRNGNWNNWFFYKTIISVFDLHFDSFIALSVGDREHIATQVLSRLLNIWLQDNPKSPLSPYLWVDTLGGKRNHGSQTDGTSETSSLTSGISEMGSRGSSRLKCE